MSRTPEEILKSKEVEIQPIIEQIDEYLDERFEGNPITMETPANMNSFIYDKIAAHYMKFGWIVTQDTDRNETYLTFTPRKLQKQKNDPDFPFR